MIIQIARLILAICICFILLLITLKTKITETNGAIVEQYEYDVFGVAYASVNNVEAVTTAQENKTLNIKKANGSETADNSDTDELTIDNIRYKRYNGVGKIGNTRLYTGREYDTELKLYYNRARYYSPDLGRFISRDPIDISDDVNLYAYVGNNGVNFVDLMGKEKALIKIVDKFNYYGVYFENLYSFKTHEIFSDITLDPEKANIKLNKSIRELGLFIDNNYTTDTSGKKIVIDGKDIWLADLGNILYGYNGQKVGYTINDIKFGGLVATSAGFDRGYKKEGILENEKEDWIFYEAGFKLAENTKSGEITKEDILNTYFSIFENGR